MQTESLTEEERRFLETHLCACRLCPRACGANRIQGERGLCGETAQVRAGLAWLHRWEEPCLTGERGSGAVFFSGCSLGCVFCQNHEISLPRDPHAEEGSGGTVRTKLTVPRLSEVFLHLQRRGAANINLVTGCHFIPQIVLALSRAKREGLEIPVVWNSSGYESAEALRLLQGFVDIWLPDFKFMDPVLSGTYAHAPDYPGAAKSAIREMVRQNEAAASSDAATGRPAARCFSEDGTMTRGVIVRVLLLPGHVRDAGDILTYLHQTYGSEILLSIMNQYTPMPSVLTDPLLGRRVTRREYRRLLDRAFALGIEDAYIQEGAAASESFVPAFDGTGL